MTALVERETARLAPMPLPPLPARPMVSVLLSNYNYASYLPEAIESVLAQTYDHWELILVDDGSTDASREVMRAYCARDGRIRMLAKRNGGQATGFNAAWALATGDIIALFDADDTLRTGKLQAAVEAHLRVPHAGFCVHRVQRVDKHMRGRGVWPAPGRLPQGWHGDELLRTGGVLDYLPPTAALSLHRAVAARLFPLPEEKPLSGLADQVIMRLAPLLTSLVSVEAVLSDYRFHGANTFERHTITPESTAREIANLQALWKAQEALLGSIDLDLPRQLAPLADNGYLLQQQYIHARLTRSAGWPEAYRRYLRHLETDRSARFLSFWRASRRMPLPVFSLLLDGLLQPGHMKQWLARLRGAA